MYTYSIYERIVKFFKQRIYVKERCFSMNRFMSESILYFLKYQTKKWSDSDMHITV